MSGVVGLLVRLDPETSETGVTPHPDDLEARVLKQPPPSRRFYDDNANCSA